jgi:hypothetical protein
MTIMHVLRSPVFIVCLLLFTIHQVLQKGFQIHFTFFDRYLDNLLAMPVILTLLLAERRWLTKKNNNYTLPLLDIIIATVYIIIISEIVFPLLSPRFTTDWMDVFFSATGSVIFYYTINKAEDKK